MPKAGKAVESGDTRASRGSGHCSRCGERFSGCTKERTLCGICLPRDNGVDWASVPPTWQGRAKARALADDRDDATAAEKEAAARDTLRGHERVHHKSLVVRLDADDLAWAWSVGRQREDLMLSGGQIIDAIAELAFCRWIGMDWAAGLKPMAWDTDRGTLHLRPTLKTNGHLELRDGDPLDDLYFLALAPKLNEWWMIGWYQSVTPVYLIERWYLQPPLEILPLLTWMPADG